MNGRDSRPVCDVTSNASGAVRLNITSACLTPFCISKDRGRAITNVSRRCVAAQGRDSQVR